MNWVFYKSYIYSKIIEVSFTKEEVLSMTKIKIINIVFFVSFLLIITIGFIKSFVFPVDINYAENRTANKMPSFTFSSFLDKSYQDKYEDALADQIPLSSKMKKFEKTAELIAKLAFFQMDANEYHWINSNLLYKDGYLIYAARDFSKIKEQLDHKIHNLNQVVEQKSDFKAYLYYIEKDTDMDFESGSRLNAYEYITNRLNRKFSTKKFRIDSFDEFKNYFYKTDHHWNHKGSYRAYKEIVEWMDVGKPILNSDEISLQSIMSGSKAAGIGGTSLFKEQLFAYRFDMPRHDIFLNGKREERYGNYIDYFENKKAIGSYSDFYGGDTGLIEFDYHQDKKDNLLIIGESYDNAINELLASHFNHTYNVDLRNYERENGKVFNFFQFIEEHEIDRVLLIGNIDYYVLEEFELKGGD